MNETTRKTQHTEPASIAGQMDFTEAQVKEDCYGAH
jgi:hypothetical protein